MANFNQEWKFTPKKLRNRFDKWVEMQQQETAETMVNTTSQKRQGADGKTMLQKFENKRTVPVPLLIEEFLEYAGIYRTWDVCVRHMQSLGGYDPVIAHIQNVIKAHNRRGYLLGYYKS